MTHLVWLGLGREQFRWNDRHGGTVYDSRHTRHPLVVRAAIETLRDEAASIVPGHDLRVLLTAGYR